MGCLWCWFFWRICRWEGVWKNSQLLDGDVWGVRHDALHHHPHGGRRRLRATHHSKHFQPIGQRLKLISLKWQSWLNSAAIALYPAWRSKHMMCNNMCSLPLLSYATKGRNIVLLNAHFLYILIINIFCAINCLQLFTVNEVNHFSFLYCPNRLQ